MLIIHRQVKFDVVGVWDGGFGDDVGDGEEGVEAFCDAPGQTLLFGFVLGVAGCHVDAERIACLLVNLPAYSVVMGRIGTLNSI